MACADHNIKDLSSYANMRDGGWNLNEIDENERLVLPKHTCDTKFNRIDKQNWIVEGWSNQMMSTTFWGAGRVEIKFANCNKDGEVTVLLDGAEIAKSKSHGKEVKATFNVEEGSVLEIKTDNRSIIRIKGFQIDCGKLLRNTECPRTLKLIQLSLCFIFQMI